MCGSQQEGAGRKEKVGIKIIHAVDTGPAAGIFRPKK